nr:cytochrome P450 [Sphingomonas sp. CDS-1]
MNASDAVNGDSAARCPFDFNRTDLSCPAIQENPYDYYDWLRSNEPVRWDDHLRAYVVTSDVLVRKAALDWQTFSNVGTRDFGSRSDGAADADAIRAQTHKTEPLTVVLDPPRHTQYRRIMNQALTTQRMKDSKLWIEDLATQYIEAMLSKGGGDFVADFCIPLPFAVITRLLGLPADMRDKMREWADSYTEQFKGSISREREIECAYSYVEYHQFFEGLIEERRAANHPPDDLVSAIARSRLDDGNLISMADALSLIEQFVTAGAETTMNALSMGAHTLATRPDLLIALRERPDRVEAFVEETLRIFAPAQGLFRVVMKDTELGGIPLPKGSRIMLRWGAANTDAATFADPRSIDLDRANARQHVTFGYGIHKCQGSPLARIELNATFAALGRLCRSITIDEDGDGTSQVHGIIFMGMTRLPLRMS